MPATSFYKNAAHNGQNPSPPLDIEINNDENDFIIVLDYCEGS